jgi:hypothetical protein
MKQAFGLKRSIAVGYFFYCHTNRKTMIISEIITNYLFQVTAVITGVIGFRYFNRVFRLLVVLVVASLLANIIGRYIRLARVSNLDLYYGYLLLEAILQWLVALYYFKDRRSSIIISIAFLAFLGCWGFEAMQNNFEAFADAHLMECILLVVLYLVILLRSIHQPKAHALRSNPYFWLSLGIIIYKAGAIPCWAMFGHLKPDPKTAEQLFVLINNPLTAVQDLMMAISFYLYYRNARREAMQEKQIVAS